MDELRRSVFTAPTHVLTCLSSDSIGEARYVVRTRWPKAVHHVTEMHDIGDESFWNAQHYAKPSPRNIADILEFARTVELALRKGTPVRMLIHCAAGISRSTAAATVVLRYLLGAGHEDGAVARVFDVRDIAWPNRRVIRLADERLGCGGKLVNAVASKSYTSSRRYTGARLFRHDNFDYEPWLTQDY